VIRLSVPSDNAACELLVAQARAVARTVDADPDAVGWVVRQVAEDAVARTSVDREHSEVTLIATTEGTELILRLEDHGVPISGPPALPIGSAAHRIDASIGDHANVTEMWFGRDLHHVVLDHGELEIIDHDAATTDIELTQRELRVDDALELSRLIYRCYGWSYPGSDLYYPERIAAAIAEGRRIGQVAMTAAGDMAAHWGAVLLADGVVETGSTVTDPRFRGRGLARQLDERLMVDLDRLQITGRLREPVLTHSATQHIALEEGAQLVGLHLKANTPMRQVGITNGVLADRVSLTVMYSPLSPLDAEALWIPDAYRALVEHVLAPTGWQRTLGQHPGSDDVASSSSSGPATVLSTTYDGFNHLGMITVLVVGPDLEQRLRSMRHDLQRTGAQCIQVRLPAASPALLVYGQRLDRLGFGFASLLPRFGELGDVLTLQWLADARFDLSGWQYANEHVEQMAIMITDQIASLLD
jgi:GNAT superfamily N-acetyltransferase